MPLFDVVALCAQVPGGAVGMRGHSGGKPQAGGDGEVFTQIGKGKIRKFGNFVGREQNPSSILRGGKPFLRSKISKFSVL